MTEEALAELERLLTEMLAWAEARGEDLYRLHAEVARLREAIDEMLQILGREYGTANYMEDTSWYPGPLMDAADGLIAALSTPADVTEDGGRWDYEVAMRQYDIQQKRACEAEAEVARLREALDRAAAIREQEADDEL